MRLQREYPRAAIIVEGIVDNLFKELGMKRIAPVLVTMFVIGCTPEPTPAVPPTAPAPEPVASAPAPSAATSRADALIEDLRRREAAQAKYDRENPPPPAPRLQDLVRPSSAPVSADASVATPSAVAASVPSSQSMAAGAPVGDTRGESWWKNEMRTAEVRLAENLRRLQEANDQMAFARKQMDTKNTAIFTEAQEAFNRASAEAGRLNAEVRNDRAAVERIREDARRANVPPGWLRWP